MPCKRVRYLKCILFAHVHDMSYLYVVSRHAFLLVPSHPQADRATNLIYSAVRFRNALADGKLEPEVYHLNPEKSDTEMFRNVIRCVCVCVMCVWCVCVFVCVLCVCGVCVCGVCGVCVCGCVCMNICGHC